MINKELVESGLSDMYAISPLVDSEDPRAIWLGKTVKYQSGLNWNKYGTLARDEKFEVREVQIDFEGAPSLRIYCLSYEDTFGRVVSSELIEEV